MTTTSKRASTIKSEAIRKSTKAAAKISSKGIATTTGSAISYTFENGLEVKGTIDQLEAIATSMKLSLNYKSIGHRPVGFYPSTSKGMVKMSSMNDYHLRRALLKEAKEYFTGVYASEYSNVAFLNKFMKMADQPLVVELFTELSTRK